MATMGFAPAAAIGAKIGAPDKPVMCLVGDGGLLSVVGALATSVELGIPVVWVLFNNFCFSTIRSVGDTYFKNTYGTEFTTPDGTPYNPDFVMLAKSFGIEAALVEEPRDLAASLKKAIDADVPYLLEVRTRADVPMPRLAHGWIVTATVSRGRLRAIDTSATLGMPGVLGVLDHRDAPRLNPEAGNYFGPDGSLQLLQDDVIPYAGQPIALVLAETLEQARAAAGAIRVDYDVQPHDVGFHLDHPASRPASTAFGPEADTGDVDAELAASAVVVDERYRTPEECHSAMEPHAATAWWENGHLYAVDSNQGAFSVSQVLAALWSIDRDRVHVRSEHVGGGFGGKGLCGPQVILAAMAGERFERPVRVTLTREQVFEATASRPPTDQQVRIGADTDGHLRAVHHRAAYALSPLAEYIEWCTR